MRESGTATCMDVGMDEKSECHAKWRGQDCLSKDIVDPNLGFRERAISAAGAAFLSAIIVNPLDVAKTRLQAQASGLPYQSHCNRSSVHYANKACIPECSHYTGTLDVFYKVIRQEGYSRLWRGTYASLALAVPTVGIYLPFYDIFRNLMEEFTTKNASNLTPYIPLVASSLARSLACISCYPVELARTRMQAFASTQVGRKPPGILKTLIEVINPIRDSSHPQRLRNYRMLWAGIGAQIARDVPFSAICWMTLEHVRRKTLYLQPGEATTTTILGANFSAGFVAGSLAAAATCPLDVARTRRQIEKDPGRSLTMTTRQTLKEIWRDGGMKGMFTGVGARVGRAGPSVGIVVSFYELMKFVLNRPCQRNVT